MRIIQIVLIVLFIFLSPQRAFSEPECFAPSNMIPALLDTKNYSEFWQQVFLFEDGTFITSEFLVANFGFSTHHGILLSTLVRPNGDRYIIKNGRTRSGWNFKADPFSINIYQHSLIKDQGGYDLTLDNTMAQVNLNLTSQAEPWSAERLMGKKKKIWQDVDFFAPALLAEGYWTPGPETELKEDYETRFELKGGVGFAMHGVQSENLHELMSSWLKLFGFGKTGKAKPFLSSVMNINDGQENSFMMSWDGLENEAFKNITIKTIKTQTIDETEVPKIIEIEANAGDKTLKGTIQLNKILETFVLNNHLNALEKVSASSQPKLKRFRFQADYSFLIEKMGEKSNIEGQALGEYIDVVPPKGIRRRRSRE